MAFVVGVDIGGTFTDCVVIDADRKGDDPLRLVIGKAASTPPDFQSGFIAAMAAAAEKLGIEVGELAARAQGIYHGCTVGTNALVEHRTARVGFLTSRGHRDSLFTMRAGSRLKHEAAELIAHVAAHTKPDPLVPKNLCGEIDERVTFDGRVLVELNEERARAEIQRLVDEGAEAFAVCLLWSVANADHERRLKELIGEVAPDAFVSLSSDLISRVGEYERMVATVVNSLIGPVMTSYIARLEGELVALGYDKSLQIMTCSGGLIHSEYARTSPLLTIGSGPVAGLIGANNLVATTAAQDGDANAVTVDMGGTTLDIGVIWRGDPLGLPTANYGQYEYFVPALDVRSIGAGGGSIVRYESGGSLRVGPESAGARPGPACYRQGGEHPTVTDADLVLGFLNPGNFLGGSIQLDVEAARDALGQVGDPLGFSPEQTAAAAARIVDNQMVDAIRLASIQRGYDIRDFDLYAYGGAGAVHASALAKELGMARVVVPLNELAAGWSAFGVSSSEALVVQEQGVGMTEPFDPAALTEIFVGLEADVLELLEAQGMAAQDIRLERFADIRYTLQVNQVEVRAPDGRYDDAGVATLLDTFESEYERLYGVGTGYAAAGFAITALRVRGRAALTDFTIEARRERADAGEPALKEERPVIWYEHSPEPIATPIHDGVSARPGMVVKGPAIIEYPDTTVVVRPSSVARYDELGSVVIDI